MSTETQEIVNVVDGLRISAIPNPSGLEILVNDCSIGAIDFFGGKLQFVIDDPSDSNNTRLIPVAIPEEAAHSLADRSS